MANLAIVTPTISAAVGIDTDPTHSAKIQPAMAWPATGGSGGTKIDAAVFVPIVSPTGSVAAGGSTIGQLFPVGNR